MKVQELIDKKGTTVHAIQVTTTVGEAARVLLEKEVGSLLVCEGDKVSGIFTKNDLLRRYLASPSDFASKPLQNRPTRPLFSTTLDADLSDVFNVMVERGIRHVPVLDGGKAVGMVTPIDILLYLKEAVQHDNQQLIRYIQGSY